MALLLQHPVGNFLEFQIAKLSLGYTLLCSLRSIFYYFLDTAIYEDSMFIQVYHRISSGSFYATAAPAHERLLPYSHCTSSLTA